MRWLDGVSTSLLQKGLDGTWARQNATLNNIANYETPGYKRQFVTFEEELREATFSRQDQTFQQRVSNIKNTAAFTGTDDTLTLRADGNNVDIEEENIELARAQLQFSTYTRQLSDHFSRLRYAISGGTK